MYKKAIEKDLQQIFETRRVDFVGVENCIEQDTLCVDISRVRTGAQEGKAWARVYGSVGIRGTIKKNPSGFLTKKIAEAEPEVLKRFWFAPVEMPASTPTGWELKATKLDFVYFYREEYAPVKGILEYAKMFWDMVVNAIPKNPIDPIPEPEPEPEPELPTSNGIDEHTLACWHFDGNLIDEVSGLAFKAYQTGSFAEGKFGKYAHSIYGGRPESDTLLTDQPINGDFTIDCIAVSRSYMGAQTNMTLIAGGDNNYYGLSAFLDMKNGLVSLAHGYADLISVNVEPFSFGSMPHFALQKKGNFGEVFLEGKRVIKYDLTSILSKLTGKGFKISGGSSTIGLDEARISKVARYDADFTPPEKPYSA